MENAFSEPCPNCSVRTKVEPYVTIFSFFQEFYPREIFLTVKIFYTQRLPHVLSLSLFFNFYRNGVEGETFDLSLI